MKESHPSSSPRLKEREEGGLQRWGSVQGSKTEAQPLQTTAVSSLLIHRISNVSDLAQQDKNVTAHCLRGIPCQASFILMQPASKTGAETAMSTREISENTGVKPLPLL